MPHTMPDQAAATPRESLAPSRGLRRACPQDPASPLREVAREAIRRVGKQSAAATDIGIHEGRLAHKLSDGTISLGELEKLGPSYAAEFARQLLERCAPLVTPQARIRQQIRAIRAAVDEIEQGLEFVQ